jgi:RNA polymerase sigma-70 factor (ECF subfamily)
MSDVPVPAGPARAPNLFATTHWSLVLEARGTDESSRAALETLCRTYWYPIYAFVRRRGADTHRAQDLTQEFFRRLLADDSISTARQERGRFRTFLLGALKNFLANDWRDSQRLKRGGGTETLAWESLEPERRYALEPADGETPESLFDRRWAHAVVQTALTALGDEMRREGTSDRFTALQSFLQGGGDDTSYATTSAVLGLSVAATKSAIFRMRRRYGELIREHIAQTVATPAEIETEIQYLITLLGRR